MVRREPEEECGGKCEMKATLKVTFFLRKIKMKSFSSAEINSDNEVRYIKKSTATTLFSMSSLPWVSSLSFSTCPPGHIHQLVVVYSSSFSSYPPVHN